MKKLKDFSDDLKSKAIGYHELSDQEKKQINGGYTSKEECEESCGDWQTWPGGPSGGGTCYVVSADPERWECMDS